MKLEKNALVFADNLEFLERAESNIADLIYLDPPWNTSSDFNYSNNNLDSATRKKEYDEFLFKVIQQAHRILKSAGNLIFYSNPSMNVNFHNLISPIFGLNNFRAEFIIPKQRLNIRNKTFLHNHETVIHYSKTDEYFFNSTSYLSESKLKELFPLEDAKGRFRIVNLTVPGSRENLSFEWKGYKLPSDCVWRFSEKKLNELLAKNKIYVEADLLLPKLKEYSSEKSASTLSSVWDDIPVYDLSNELPTAQSQELLSRIISISTSMGGLIIDPFAGSGTSLIVANKLNRNWCGIDNSRIAIIECKKRLDLFEENNQYEFLDKENLSNEIIIWNDYLPFANSELDVIRSKISGGENERVEFKESLIWSHFQNIRDGNIIEKVLKEIAAFMNSKLGGSIILGVKDDRSIIGLEKDYELANSQKADCDGFDLYLSDIIKAKLGPNAINLYHLKHFNIDEKNVCEIQIDHSTKPIFFNAEFFTRNGTQAIKLKTEDFFKFVIENNKK